LDSGHASNVHYTGFDRIVCAERVIAREARYRSGVDDRALSIREHHFDRALGRVPIRGQPDVDCFLPSFECDIADSSDGREDGVIVEDIEAAKSIAREFDHSLDLRRRADVGAKEFGGTRGFANIGDDAIAALFIEIDDNYSGSLSREGFRS